MQCAHFAMSTLCTLGHHFAHCAHCAHYCFPHCFLFFSGPHWFRKGRNKLLLAARRSDETRRRETAGNIADGLRCCLWRRAEKPEKMTHRLAGGGYNCRGSPASASKRPGLASARVSRSAQTVGFLEQNDLPLHPRLPSQVDCTPWSARFQRATRPAGPS
jgi:hypothetical protein